MKERERERKTHTTTTTASTATVNSPKRSIDSQREEEGRRKKFGALTQFMWLAIPSSEYVRAVRTYVRTYNCLD